MKSKRFGSYVKFDEMVWPLPGPDLEWALRYGNPTREQILHAASILEAYQQTITDTQKKRNFVFGELQKHFYEVLDKDRE